MEHFKKRLIHQIEKSPENLSLEPPPNKIIKTSKNDDNTKSSEADNIVRLDHLVNNSEMEFHDTHFNTRPESEADSGVSSNISESGLLGSKSESEVLDTKSDNAPTTEVVVKKTKESEASSSSGIPSATSVDKKKEVIQKIARKKSVCRSHFRHENIPIFKLGHSIHDLKKNILVNVQIEKKPEKVDKNVPKESLTADIILAMDGNKSPLGRHNLPKILSSEDLRKHTEHSDNRHGNIRQKPLEISENKRKSEKKREHRHRDKNEKKHKNKGDKDKTKFIKPLKISFKNLISEETNNEEHIINDMSKEETGNTETATQTEKMRNHQDSSESSKVDNLTTRANEESHLLINSVTSNVEGNTLEKYDDQDVAHQNSNPVVEMANANSNRFENNSTTSPVQIIAENNVIIQNRNSSKINTSVSAQTESSNSPDLKKLQTLNTSKTVQNGGTGSSSSKISSISEIQHISTALEAPVISIERLNDDRQIDNRNVIQIRLAPINPANEIEKRKPVFDDAYLESLLSLVKSTMQPTKICIALLGVLNYYYKDLSQRLETDISMHYKEKIKQTLEDILLYIEKQLFGITDNRELKKYTKQIMESDLKKHKDFLDAHLHLLDKKHDDPLWMEKFIQTLTQNKQYPKISTEMIMDTSYYKRNGQIELNKTSMNLKSTSIQNPTVMNDFYNVNASANALDKLQKFQASANSNTKISNLPEKLPNEHTKSPLISTSPLNNINHTFIVPSSIPNPIENAVAINSPREKRKYLKRRHSTHITSESVPLQQSPPALGYAADACFRNNGIVPEAPSMYNYMNPGYLHHIKNVRENYFPQMQTNEYVARAQKDNSLSQFAVPITTSPIIEEPNVYTNSSLKDPHAIVLKSMPRQYENKFAAMQSKRETDGKKSHSPYDLTATYLSKEVPIINTTQQINSESFDPWHHYRNTLNLNHYLNSGQIRSSSINYSPPMTRSYSCDGNMPAINITSHSKNVVKSQSCLVANGTTDKINQLTESRNLSSRNFTQLNNNIPQIRPTSRIVENSESRNYSQNVHKVGTNVLPKHFNGLSVANRTQWNLTESNNFNQPRSNSQTQGGEPNLPKEKTDNWRVFGSPFTPRQPRYISANNVEKMTSKISEQPSTNLACISAPINNLNVERTGYAEHVERSIDKLRINQRDTDSAAVQPSISQNPKIIENRQVEMISSNYLEPQDFSIRRTPHSTSPQNNISRHDIPDKSNEVTLNRSTSSVKRNGCSFRIENLVSAHTNKDSSQIRELSNNIENKSSQVNTRPAVVSSFNFLQEICSPPPSTEINNPEVPMKSHRINLVNESNKTGGDSEHSSRIEVATNTPNQTVPNSEGNKKCDRTDVDKNDGLDKQDATVVKKVILQDNSMQITKEPVTQTYCKVEQQTDIVVVEKIKTDSYETTEDKKGISKVQSNSYGRFDRMKTMVDLLKTIRPDVYREVRRKTDMKAFNDGAMEVTAVITIDDDDETATTSPESVTIEKITEPSEEVSAKKARMSEDNSSDSVIITTEQTIQQTSSPRIDLQSTDRTDQPKAIEIGETDSDCSISIASQTTQIEFRRLDQLSGQTIQIDSEDSEPANSIPTDLSMTVQGRKVSPTNVKRLEIHYTTPGRITSPKIQRQFEYSQSSITALSSPQLELLSPRCGLTPSISTLPDLEDISDAATQMASDTSDGTRTDHVTDTDLDWTKSSLGTIVNRRRCSGPLDLSVDDDQNSTIPYPSSNSTLGSTVVEGTGIKRQDLVSSPIHSDLTAVRSPTKYNSTKDWKSSFTEDPKKNFREFYKIRRYSVESRSSFSDTSSPIPLDDMATVTMGNSNFHIRKMFLDYIPKGKLYYKKETNTFVQCYVNGETRQLQIVNEPQLPQQWIFSSEADFDDAALFSKEFEKVQKFVPKDFAQYYRFVTGYQILRTLRPISFHTFLEMHNGDRMDIFFVKYLNHLQKFSLSGVSNPEDWNVS